jgi:hypothetical protein
MLLWIIGGGVIDLVYGLSFAAGTYKGQQIANWFFEIPIRAEERRYKKRSL